MCEFCVEGEASDVLRGESDTPEHCAECGRPLDHELTEKGAEYIFQRMEETSAVLLRKRKRDRHALGPWPEGHYYHGSPAYAVVEEWVERLDSWVLAPWARARIAFFRALVKRGALR